MLQKKTKYAIKALLSLAKEYKDNKPMKISEIAEKEGIPRKFLEAMGYKFQEKYAYKILKPNKTK